VGMDDSEIDALDEVPMEEAPLDEAPLDEAPIEDAPVDLEDAEHDQKA